MRLHNFFIPRQSSAQAKKEVGDNLVITEPDLIHQWRKVFRLKIGDKVILLDDSGRKFVSQFIKLEKNMASLSIIERVENNNTPEREIFLYQSILKKNKFELIAQKATELGVVSINPLLSERSEKKSLNVSRLKKIIKEASEQSGRGITPVLEPPVSLEEAISNLAIASISFHTDGQKFYRDKFSNEKSLAVFIGPEGGWSDREIELFKNKNIPVLKLGHQTLRAETAAISALALFLL